MGHDNASQRVLSARRTLRDNEHGLENTFGRTLPDGAQCFVIEEQANYRLVHGCTLPEDDRYVVMPKGDRHGRWVRADGLAGFALLEGGNQPEGTAWFRNYTYQKVVQFEVTPEALVYIGSVPRLAHLSASARDIPISIMLQQGKPRVVASGSGPSGAALVHPGERIVVAALGPVADPLASLQVILA